MLSLLLFVCFSVVAAFDLNQWNKTTGAEGEDIWYSTSNFIPVKSASFGSIKIGRIMSVEFDFIFGGRTDDPVKAQTEMFFRVGYDAVGGTSCDAQNSRYPSLWLFDESNALYVSASDSTGCSHLYSLEEYGNLSVSTPYHLLIAFDDTHLFVGIGEIERNQTGLEWTKEWDRSPTSESHLGDEVPVWFMSGKYGPSQYNRANGTFFNMRITSKWFSFNAPTNQPTANPTVIVTVDQSVNSSNTETPHVSSSESMGMNTTDFTTNDTIPSLQSPPPSTPTTTAIVYSTTVMTGGGDDDSIDSHSDLVRSESSSSSSSEASMSWTHLYVIGGAVIILALCFMVIICATFQRVFGSQYLIIHRSQCSSYTHSPGSTPAVTVMTNVVRSESDINQSHRGHRINPSESVAVPLPLMSGPVSYSSSPLMIENALAVIICIAEYGDDPDPDHLQQITEDYANLHTFFKTFLNFDILPDPIEEQDPFSWTETKLAAFMMNEVGRALFGGTDRLQYDGLIVCFSCHGVKDGIITSDLRKIEKDALHRAVSLFHPKIREIPRIFIIETCDGPRDRQISVPQSSRWSSQRPANAHYDTSNGNDSPVPFLSVNHSSHYASGHERQCTVKNPNYNLAVICAESNGMGGNMDSSLITLLIDAIKENDEEKHVQKKRFADILEEIQEKLHQRGYSYPTFRLNGRTRHVVITSNDNW